MIHESINSDQPTWVSTLLASNFWRILGKPKEAIDCLRKSIKASPPDFKHFGLLSLANVFHRTHNSHDAISALELALKFAPDNPALYFTMGNVYATLMQFNNSAKSYNEALKLQPQFDAAKLRRHAVLCHQKLENALEDQHRSLEATLNELRQYKRQHDEWSALLNKILAEQASIEARMESRMEYEEFKMRQSKNGKGQNCFQQINSLGMTMVTCSLTSENDLHRELWSHPTQTKDVKTKNVESLIQKFEKYSTEDSEDSGLDDEPSLPPKYATWPKLEASLLFENKDWPLPFDCSNHLSLEPSSMEHLSVFLSPENRGFE